MYAILRQKPPSRNETYVLVFMLLSPISLYENDLQIILFFFKEQSTAYATLAFRSDVWYSYN